MSFTVHDFSDLIEILNTQPEWRQMLRQTLYPEMDLVHILEELMTMQRELVATQQELKALVATILKKLAQHDELLRTLVSDVAESKANIAENKVNITKNTHDVDELKKDMRWVKGLTHEQYYRSKATGIFGRYLRRGRDVTDRVGIALYEALQAGQISDSEQEAVLAADVLWAGKLHRQPDVEVVLVLEASWVAEETDVIRAATRAEVLRRIGLKAMPVVGAREWNENTSALARQQKVVITANGYLDKESWQLALGEVVTT